MNYRLILRRAVIILLAPPILVAASTATLIFKGPFLMTVDLQDDLELIKNEWGAQLGKRAPTSVELFYYSFTAWWVLWQVCKRFV